MPSTIPGPGSYQFKDAAGRIIYVGKAKSLRSRVMSYFSHRSCPSAPCRWCSTADTVEWIAVRNEVEALFLEFNLIKKHRPRFNIRLKDDKSYPYLAVTLDEEWPRAMVMRGAKRKGVRYFGPYAHAYAIRETLDLLLRTFPIRTCTKNKFDRHAPARAPVPLRAHREVRGAVRRRGHPRRVHGARRTSCIEFLDGEHRPILDRLDKQMHEASDALEFERAARLRDQIISVRKAIERQQMVDAKEEDYDVIGMVDDPLEASVQVFLVRKGRVVGRKGLVVDKVEDVEPARAGRPAARAALRRRSRAPTSPARSSCPSCPTTPSSTRSSSDCSAGARCACACRSAAPSVSCWRRSRRTRTRRSARHKLKRASDHNARARALVALQDALRSARSAAAHRVLRHLEPPGHRDRRRRWW